MVGVVELNGLLVVVDEYAEERWVGLPWVSPKIGAKQFAPE